MNTLLGAADETADTFPGHTVKRSERIMVVDDDANIRHLLAETLIHLGFEVDDAYNGAHAWKAVHLKCYDLLITDYDMPRMTGLQLVHKLRAAGFELPIIIATGKLPSDFDAKQESLGAIAVIPKPFTLEELFGMVNKTLSVPVPDFSTHVGQLSPDRVFCHANYA